MFNQLFFELLVLSYVGVLIHFLTKVREARVRKISMDPIVTGISFIISVLLCTAMVYTRESFADIYPMTGFTSLVLGYTSQSAFAKLMSIKNIKNETNP